MNCCTNCGVECGEFLCCGEVCETIHYQRIVREEQRKVADIEASLPSKEAREARRLDESEGRWNRG